MLPITIFLMLVVTTIVSAILFAIVLLSLIDLHQVGTKVVRRRLTIVQITCGRPSDTSFCDHPCAEILCWSKDILMSCRFLCHVKKFILTIQMTSPRDFGLDFFEFDVHG